MLKQIRAGVLQIAYEENGIPDGNPVFLMHGFPYDIRAYDAVIPILVKAGCRVITPYLRGYGPTNFLSRDTIRSGEQAALAHDLLSLMDALSIDAGVLAGYDWGGRAACIVAALWPGRVLGLVSGGGYNIQNIPASIKPQPPELEFLNWYQFYFHTERGRLGLSQYRNEFCKLLWKLWSPTWKFEDATYELTAASFNNQDFVEVVIHSYRHRFGLVSGDPVYANTEKLLADQPKISVPTITIDGGSDGVSPLRDGDFPFFTGKYERRIIPSAGHNLPQESPDEFASAILSLI
jgi:pimeloyl-ACP methyl ester carboxylesterase